MIDRKAHWQKIYRDKPYSEVSWYQKEPVLSLEMIQRCGVCPDEALIDVGGGASLLVDSLCSRGFTNLSVLDIAGPALSGARQRLGDRATCVDWIEADVTAFRPPHEYSLWHDRAVFHFLTEEADRRRYVGTLKQALRPGGHLIIAAFAIGGPSQCSGLDIVQYDPVRLMSELGDEFVLLEQRNEQHFTPDQREQQFVYFRLQRGSADVMSAPA